MKIELDVEIDYTNPNNAQIPYEVWYKLLKSLFKCSTYLSYNTEDGDWELIINNVTCEIKYIDESGT